MSAPARVAVTVWHICDGSRPRADRLVIRPSGGPGRCRRPQRTGQPQGTPKRPDQGLSHAAIASTSLVVLHPGAPQRHSQISPPRTGRRRILPWIGWGQVPAGGVNADAALDAAAFGCTAANTPRWRPGCAGLRTRGRARHSRAVATTPSPLSRLRRGWRSREGLGEQPLVAVAGLVHGPAWAATKP
jgi:hypothetical protein